MMIKPIFLAGLLLTLGACASLPDHPIFRPDRLICRSSYPIFSTTQTGLDASALLSELERVASLSAEQRRRELAGLEDERRLDIAQRFQLAALLEREDSVETLERSLRTLNINGSFDTRAQPLVELMKKSLKARIALKQETVRTQELQDKLKQETVRTQELQDKLDKMKALERSLRQRDRPSRTR